MRAYSFVNIQNHFTDCEGDWRRSRLLTLINKFTATLVVSSYIKCSSDVVVFTLKNRNTPSFLSLHCVYNKRVNMLAIIVDVAVVCVCSYFWLERAVVGYVFSSYVFETVIFL